MTKTFTTTLCALLALSGAATAQSYSAETFTRGMQELPDGDTAMI